MPTLTTSAGVRLFYHDLPGPGSPLVFVHGLGCSSSCDYPQVAASQALARHRRVLVDLPGFGFSDKAPAHDYSLEAQVRSLGELIVALDLSEINLFGHSMGGAIAVALATVLGPRVRSLVIAEGNLDAGGGPTSRRVAGSALAEYEARGQTELVEAARREGNLVWASSLEVSSPRAVHQGAVDLVRGVQPSWRTQLQVLSSPKTYLYGERNFDAHEAGVLRTQGVAVGVVPAAGHNMAHDNPEGLARCIAEALPGARP